MSMRFMLGDEFVALYCKLKDAEFLEYQEIITPWEREILMFNVQYYCFKGEPWTSVTAIMR